MVIMKRELSTLLGILCLLFSGSAFCQQERNLLTGNYKLEVLSNTLVSDNRWVPFPQYADRRGWNKLFAPVYDQIIQDGEKGLNYQWQVVKATDYLAYERNGSRVIMEKPINANANALSSLFFAELAEGKGRYLDQIINGVWYFTEMSTWSLSAHVPAFQSSKRTLPQSDTEVVDLMAGDLGSMLSWIHYYFKPQMDKVNPEISNRLKLHLQKRIIEPYLQRNDMWWLGFKLNENQLVNNWNPWCNFNVLTTILLIEDNTERRRKGVFKSMRSVDKFLNYVKQDGACEEGPSYWGHAAGKLYDYLKLLSLATENKISIFDNQMVRDMGEYIGESYIGGDHWVVNFADASAKGGGDPSLIFRYGKAVNSEQMMQFGKYLSEKKNTGFTVNRDIFRGLEYLTNVPQMASTKPALPSGSSKWYNQTEFLYLKQGNAFFAAKGGYNNESHNHNDVGTFIYFKDQKPLFVDAGVGTYNKKTFSSERYNIWTMQSGYHSLPQINGVDQSYGRQYKASEVVFNEAKNTFSLNIAGAYPAEASVKKWTRSYVLNKDALTINDHFEIQGASKANIVHFLVAERPSIGVNGTISLNDGSHSFIFNSNDFAVSIEEIKLDDSRLSSVWGPALYRISLEAKKIKDKGTYKFQIK